jgi:hypothetical protein
MSFNNPLSDDPSLAAITQRVESLSRLVETSHFEEEEERANLLRQLKDLNREIVDGFETHGLPDTFHEALQHTETYAISRLGGEDSKSEEDLDVSWHDLRTTLSNLIDSWEAKHPAIGAAFMNVMSMLSKLGI